MNTTLIRAAMSAAFLALALPAMAEDAAAGAMHHEMTAPVSIGDIELSAGFARSTLPNAPVAGGFLTIVNKGATDDTLIAATSPVSGEVQLHEMKMEGDVMKMQQLADGIPVPAGATVSLAPGGLHLMFMQLNQPFVEGTSIPVTLTFAKAGTVEIELTVGGAAAKAAPMDHSMHGDAGAAAHHHHGSGTDMSTAGMSDEEAIAAMQKHMFDTPESPLTMGPIVVVGEYAVSSWAQNETGGRALLRKTDNGWAIHLCAGDGLKDAATLTGMGIPQDIAGELAAGIVAAESKLDPALVARFSLFDGVMMIDENLI